MKFQTQVYRTERFIRQKDADKLVEDVCSKNSNSRTSNFQRKISL